MPPIQAVKLITMRVTRLPSPFDENELLKLWNVKFWRLKNFCCENFTNSTIFIFFKRAHQTHMRERKRQRNLIVKEKEHFLSQPLLNCKIEKTKIMIFYVNFVL